MRPIRRRRWDLEVEIFEITCGVGWDGMCWGGSIGKLPAGGNIMPTVDVSTSSSLHHTLFVKQ